MTDLMHEEAGAAVRHDAGDEPLGAVLEALRLAAVRMLASSPRAPQRLRLEAAGVAVELAWPAPTGAGERYAATGRSAAPVRDDLMALLAAAHVPGANPLPGAAEADLLAGDGHGLENGKGDGQALTRPRRLAVEDAHCVCAPTVGTFYRAPEPGSKPFVEVGDLVTVGQQLAIVEAMKLMIPVEADRAGRIKEILATDATSVEYGERLIAIAPE